MEVIEANNELNPASVGPPTRYLGADVEKVIKPGDPAGREYWSFSARTYVRNAVKNVKLLLQEEGAKESEGDSENIIPEFGVSSGSGYE